MVRGKLIVFEGIDGSGKGTQSLLLKHALKQEATVHFTFPNYNTIYGKIIGDMLNSKTKLPPVVMASLYANDRALHYDQIEELLSRGYTVICDRYVLSNIVYQCACSIGNDPLGQLANTISTIEYTLNKMPQPDLTILLDMPVEYSTKLIAKKSERLYTKLVEDMYESDKELLSIVREKYLKLIDESSKTKHIVNCVENNSLRTIESIQNEIQLAYLRLIDNERLSTESW